jgi:hypothetical protein
MNQVHQLLRVLGATDGKGRLVIPVRTYERRSDAQEAKERVDRAMRHAMGAHVFEPISEGQGRDMGRLVDFLRELGISGYSHVIEELSIETLIAAPPSNLVIP